MPKETNRSHRPISKAQKSITPITKTVKSPRPEKTGVMAGTAVVEFEFNDVKYIMSASHKLFCEMYVRHNFNATYAVQAAGFSVHRADSTGSMLLKRPAIKAYIKALTEDLSFKIGVDAERIAREYARIGFADIREIFDESNNLIDVKKLSADSAANISSIEIDVLAQKGVPIGLTKKIKLFDKINALDKLAKMLNFDGVTKVAKVDKNGNDIKNEPIDLSGLSDSALAELVAKISNKDK